MNKGITVERKPIIFKANPERVICQHYGFDDAGLVKRMIGKVLALSPQEIEELHQQISAEFGKRHRDLPSVFLAGFQKVQSLIDTADFLSERQKMVIGSMFTKEYSIEAAALFNPSMVAHPDQSGLKAGQLRVIMSLRAAGEGHISSIEFVSGVVDERGDISFDPISPFAETPNFFKQENRDVDSYEIGFRSGAPLTERVVFPVTPDESNGVEDVRLVRFADQGKITYYGTYTAYDGRNIRSKLIETFDFLNFKIHAITGAAIKDKGMALFPRKINGRYAMISRQDAENLRIMFSDAICCWDESRLLQAPEHPWQFAKLGNCGSPLETDEGWLLLIHGVGPMRKYSIGVYLLDKNDPSKVIGRLPEPILAPNEREREGYVPNVVYSCGGLIHAGKFIIPYAMSDSASGIAVVDVKELLSRMS